MAVDADGKLEVTGSFTVDSEFPAAAALADNTANPTTTSVASFGMVYDGSTWDRMPGTSTDGVTVNLGANNDVTVAGVSTAANQTTIIGHVDGIETLLGTIDADTGNISTKIDTLAGAVSGTEVQVDVLTMPTTTVQATNLDIRDLVSTADSVALKNSAGTRELDIVAGGDSSGARGVGVWGSDGSLMKQLSVNTNGHVNIADGGNSITVDNAALSVTGGGVEASALRVTLASDSTGLLSVDDNGSSLTIDNAALSVTGGGVEASALRVTLANDSTGVLSVDDNGGSLTIDASSLPLPTGAATSANQSTAITSLQLLDNVVYTEGDTDATITGVPILFEDADTGDTLRVPSIDHRLPVEAGLGDDDSDFDSGAGSDFHQVVGIALPANGGHVVGGTSTNPLQIGDAGGSITVDNGGTFATQATLQTSDNVVGRVKLSDGTDVADILDLTNSNPLTVAIVDGSGDQITSFGGGTQYTEDAAAAANPVGTALNLIRLDTPAGLVTTDGDNVAARGSNYGALYTTLIDSSGNFVSVGGGTQYDEDAVHSSGAKVTLAGVVRQDTATQLAGTDGDYSVLVNDASGRLHVNVGNTVTVASHAVTNAGTFAVQVDGNALTALQKIDDPVLVDDAAFTPATSSVMMSGYEADESSTDSVDEGDAGAARMTLDRKQIVTTQPHTAGGLTIFRSIDLDETEEEVKGSAGQVYGAWVTNTATSTRWLKFYNATAANVTVGTTTPVITIGIPGNSSDDISGYFGSDGNGIAFSTAITAAATTGVADNDTGAPGANEVIVNIFYK